MAMDTIQFNVIDLKPGEIPVMSGSLLILNEQDSDYVVTLVEGQWVYVPMFEIWTEFNQELKTQGHIRRGLHLWLEGRIHHLIRHMVTSLKGWEAAKFVPEAVATVFVRGLVLVGSDGPLMAHATIAICLGVGTAVEGTRMDWPELDSVVTLRPGYV